MPYLPLLILSFVVFTGYLSYYIAKYGMQRSISASYYQLSNNAKVIFTLATFGYILPLMIVGESPFLMLATFLICLVGCAPDYKDKRQGIVHTIGAEGGIAVALTWMTFAGYWFISIPAIAIILFMILYKRMKNNTFWIEVVAYFAFLAAMIYKII